MSAFFLFFDYLFGLEDGFVRFVDDGVESVITI